MEWYWLALISALLSAMAAILEKKVLMNITALRFSVIVSVFIALISTVLINSGTFSHLTASSVIILFIKSIINASAFLCIMIALKNLEISRALPMLATAPMLVALLAFIFLGEQLTLFEIIGMVLIVAGTYILELKKNENVLTPFNVFLRSKYHKIILIAIVLMAVSSVMDKLLLTRFKLPPVTFLIMQNYFFLMIFLAYWLFSNRKNKNKNLLTGLSKSILIIIIIIAIVTVGYRLTQIQSTKLAPVGLVISLKRLSVFFAVIIGAKLFKEEDYFRKVIATVLIIAGAMLIYD